MKAVLATFAMVLMVTSAQARGTQISSFVSQLVNELGQKPHVTKVKTGETARELFEAYYIKLNGQDQFDEEFVFEEDVTSVQMSDGTGLGTTTLAGTKSFMKDIVAEFYQVDGDGNEISKEETKAKLKRINELITVLHQSGAVFGYDSNGSSVCGVTYTTLIVVDPETKTFYEISFVSGPC